MPCICRFITPLMLALAAPAALAAGEVRVSFPPADKLSDIGRPLQRQRNIDTLTAHLRALASRLPQGQVLKVEVLDVDLAGEMRLQRNGEELRVLKGGADWPRMELRWTLNGADGKALGSGHDRLADMNYLNEPLRIGQDGPLPYETRLIDRWFDAHVTTAAAR